MRGDALGENSIATSSTFLWRRMRPYLPHKLEDAAVNSAKAAVHAAEETAKFAEQGMEKVGEVGEAIADCCPETRKKLEDAAEDVAEAAENTAKEGTETGR